MRVRLAYGKTGLPIELPDDARVTIVEPKYAAGLPNAGERVRSALRAPIGAPSLSSWAGPGGRVGIVFSDITRPAPNRLLVSIVREELAHIPDDQIVLFNATGTHRPSTPAELADMLGPEIVGRYQIVQNDATDRDSHVRVGTTRSGNDIWLHRDWVGCDLHILTGFVEPHMFAGFSGGGKAVMPGMALLETVLRNHRPANIDHLSARWGIRNGNPVWEEIGESASMAGPAFLLNVTLNRNHDVTGVFAGDLDQAHAQACAFVAETAIVSVPEPFDIVIGSNSGYPLDRNLYQSVKGMSAAAQIVKNGGSILIAAECWDGIPEHGEYGRLLRETPDLKSLLATIRAPGFVRQDMWEAQIQALVSLKADVYVYSHNLSDAQLASAHLKPCRQIEATIAEIRARLGRRATLCVLPEGPQTIPFLRN